MGELDGTAVDERINEFLVFKLKCLHTVLLRSDSDSDERPFSNRHCSNGTVIGVVRVEWPNGDLRLL